MSKNNFKKILFMSLFIANVWVDKLKSNSKSNRIFIDGIAAVIHGTQVEKREIVTVSETQRPGIDNKVHDLDSLILQILFCFEAEKYHINISDEDVERKLKQVMQDNNIGKKELTAMFFRSGYTYEEGKDIFKRMITAGNVAEFCVTREALIVPKKAVERYWKENPEYTKARLVVQRGVIPYNYRQSKIEQEKLCTEEISQNNEDCITWYPAFSIDQVDISEEKQFILALPENKTSNLFRIAEGFEVYKLIKAYPEELRSIDDRYADIVDALRRPKYQEKLAAYKEKLYKQASIVYY